MNSEKCHSSYERGWKLDELHADVADAFILARVAPESSARVRSLAAPLEAEEFTFRLLERSEIEVALSTLRLPACPRARVLSVAHVALRADRIAARCLHRRPRFSFSTGSRRVYRSWRHLPEVSRLTRSKPGKNSRAFVTVIFTDQPMPAG